MMEEQQQMLADLEEIIRHDVTTTTLITVCLLKVKYSSDEM